MAKASKKRKAQSVTVPQLRRELKKYSTQRDLELWGGQLQYQMQAMEKRLREEIPKITIQLLAKTLDERIAAYTEHRAADLLGVTGDEVKLIQDKQADHEARLSKVEKVAGVR